MCLPTRPHKLQVPASDEFTDHDRQLVTPAKHLGPEPNDRPIADLRSDKGQIPQHVPASGRSLPRIENRLRSVRDETRGGRA